MSLIETQTPIKTQSGGDFYAQTVPGTPAVVKGAPGRLAKIVVITTGSAQLDIYDNATAASGTKLFSVPASVAIGTVYSVELPAVNGIYANAVASTPVVNIGYY